METTDEGRVLAPDLRGKAAVQLAVAATLGLIAWVCNALIRPVPDGTSIVEAILHPALWRGLLLTALSFTFAALAIGYFVTLAGVVVALVLRRVDRGRGVRWLIWAPPLGAAIAVVVAYVIY